MGQCNNDNPIFELPKALVEHSIRMDSTNNFIMYLDSLFDPVISEGVVFLYRIGTTRGKGTIFYYQDSEGRYRDGKVIRFDPKGGHDIKTGGGPTFWIHMPLIRTGLIPEKWTMTPCLFGEHLLGKYPDDLVCLVSAEKTAVICAGFLPEYVWVATGGPNQLGEALNVLRDREVLAYPDIGKYEEWLQYFNDRTDLNVTVSNLVEKSAIDEGGESLADIADILVNWYRRSTTANDTASQRAGAGSVDYQYSSPMSNVIAGYLSPEILPEVLALVDDLDLELESVSKMPI